jgi:hypothetical protein
MLIVRYTDTSKTKVQQNRKADSSAFKFTMYLKAEHFGHINDGLQRAPPRLNATSPQAP